jgi:hypothetical protein
VCACVHVLPLYRLTQRSVCTGAVSSSSSSKFEVGIRHDIYKYVISGRHTVCCSVMRTPFIALHLCRNTELSWRVSGGLGG